MEISFSTALNIFYVLLLSNILVAISIYINRKRVISRNNFSSKVFKFIYSDFLKTEISKKNIKKHKFLKNVKVFEEQYVNTCQYITNNETDKKAVDYFRITGSIKKHIKNLKSFNKYKKIRACVFLGAIKLPEVISALENRLKTEKKPTFKMYIADALSNIKAETSIPIIVDSLLNAPYWYRKKAHSFISDFNDKFMLFFKEYKNRTEPEIIELIIEFSQNYESESLKEYLLEKSLSEDENIALKAIKALKNKYFYYLNASEYLHHKNSEIRNIAIEALETLPTRKSIIRLIAFLEYEDTKAQAITSISNIIKKKPNLIDFVAGKFHEAENLEIRNGLTPVLANRIEYYLVNITSREKKYIKIILERIITNRKLSQIIGFLNKNKNDDIEYETLKVISKIINGKKIYKNIDVDKTLAFLNQINSDELRNEIIQRVIKLENYEHEFQKKDDRQKIELIKEKISGKEEKTSDKLLSELLRIYLKYQFMTYMQAHVLAKIDLKPYKPPRARRSEAVEKDKIKRLKWILAVLIIAFPLIFAARRFNLFDELPGWELFKLYVIDFNYYLVFYSFTINIIYLMLLVLSFLGVREQANFWKLKKRSFLFKKNILPSISIIAPAYGEQETIIESVNSLLNLQYPDYELIVVNDGSPDNTLTTLIDYFELEKVDKVIDIKLNTQPIQGIYVNKNIAKLIVVDKANGGKADALNVGINVAQKQFFCGIDSDSLLESDALIKLVSQALDETKESVAFGGNIFPINGCKVHKGKLENLKIGKHYLARLQTIEYLRAFMAGRIGWAYINSLLIISGAFGLFSKKRILEIGGYLTGSGRYRKDTVGEDMELVVRISRHMNELKKPFAVHYAFNANCWTEVPEDFKILRNQRDRWQRGLIDILNFHKPIIFNKKYGNMGKIGFPYFLIFETIGPLVEMKGYLMIILAIIFGIMNPPLALMLFSASIVMGILISVASLLIAEQETYYFSFKDLSILILYALLENFGPRQIASYWRVKGFFSSLKKPKGWGKMVRKVKSTVLLVLNNVEKTENLKSRFEKAGFRVLISQEPKSAMETIKQENIHLVISSFNYAKSTAADLRREMLTFESKKGIPFYILTKNPDKISETELEETNMKIFDESIEDKQLQTLL